MEPDDPRRALALAERGWARFELGDLPGAEADLRAAVRLDPDCAEARFALGSTLAGAAAPEGIAEPTPTLRARRRGRGGCGVGRRGGEWPARGPMARKKATPKAGLTLRLTPRGDLRTQDAEAGDGLRGAAAARAREAFARGAGHGLLHLGAAEVEAKLPPALAFWREVAGRFVAGLCARGEGEGGALPEVPFPAGALDGLLQAAPPMAGGEYLSLAVLEALWGAIEGAARDELEESDEGLEAFLRARSPAWHLVGRIHLHLAEQKRAAEAPFAFLATYTTGLGRGGKAKHRPLGKAVAESAGARDKERLLALLEPLQRAAGESAFLKGLVDSGDVFRPLAWSAARAYRFLQDVPALERSGVVVKVPDWWRRRSRPRVQVRLDPQTSGKLGAERLLAFSTDLVLDGEPLSAAERAAILAGAEGLTLVKGRWVEVDRDRLRELLDHWEAAAEAARAEGLTFAQGMRLLAGARIDADDADADLDLEAAESWTERVAGPELAEALAALRAPGAGGVELGDELRATLRPYQEAGVAWLRTLERLGLGGCLADDMGLGKTIQVIALLLLLKRDGAERPSLLVVPASLIANWQAELARFAPSLDVLIAHPSSAPRAELRRLTAGDVAARDVAITSYGYLKRLPWAGETPWELVVLDEAQAIKNPATRQTRACKALRSRVRLALTGTPVENRLSDLWSLFDFVNPGLLGSARAFGRFARALEGDYGPLRRLVQPYVLRRLKSDRAVIADLPPKTEVTAYCPLSKTQAALYDESVAELARLLDAEGAPQGIDRRGAVLAFLTRFKQICNHPAQWLGQEEWPPGESGKLGRLRALCEEIASRQEKVLVFTQYREACGPLAAFLAGVFGRPGLVLHGGVRVKERQRLVERFQEDEDAPFFVLSLKAGGTGLNLTAASHVVHFDRWWNPAVEDQATDRAYRIGQERPVLVHKLVCRGTVEERIEDLIRSKRALSEALVEGGGEAALTELSDEELLRVVALDLEAARAEA